MCTQCIKFEYDGIMNVQDALSEHPIHIVEVDDWV